MIGNKGKHAKIQPLGKQVIPDDAYVNHPEFNERIGKAMDGIGFPKNEIPKQFNQYLISAMADIAFPALCVPLPVYHQLINDEPQAMSFGILQKACDIILNSKPYMVSIDDPGSLLLQKQMLIVHYNTITEVGTMIDKMRDITDPIKKTVIDSLKAKDSIKL